MCAYPAFWTTLYTTLNHMVYISETVFSGVSASNCNAYCVLRVDQPSQNYVTNVIRNTVNPMWDEQFVV